MPSPRAPSPAGRTGELHVLGWRDDDRALLAALAMGQVGAAAGLYDRFGPDVNLLLWRLLGAARDHDAVVRQVFERALRDVSKVEKSATVRGWIISITLLIARRYLRRWREAAPEIYAHLRRLDARQGMALLLRHVHRREVDEIAAAFRREPAMIQAWLEQAEARVPAAARLGVAAAAALGDPTTDDRRRLQRLSIVDAALRYERLAPWRRRFRRAALTIPLVAVGVYAALRPASEPLDFWVGSVSQAAPVGAAVRAPNDAPLPIQLADGSTLELQAGSRGRVAVATRDEVRVELDDGKLRARLRSDTGIAWTFDAGPYEVRSSGARLGVVWDERGQGIEVRVDEGLVRVSGPRIQPGGIHVEAGRRLSAHPERGVINLGAVKSP